MRMRFTYPRPANEQDFERLCLKLLRAHWKRPQLELYARRGDDQYVSFNFDQLTEQFALGC